MQGLTKRGYCFTRDEPKEKQEGNKKQPKNKYDPREGEGVKLGNRWDSGISKVQSDNTED